MSGRTYSAFCFRILAPYIMGKWITFLSEFSFPCSFLQIYLFNCYSFLYLIEARYYGFEDKTHFKNLSDNY